ncbi:hypothetical protein [Arthrobacter sp. AZCC_0090]|nr:hypothetical protein [Arthrobacter sp. AZCC_0090]MBB6404365.1 hypothetical protein [Arthrobacter sp. AZCC_0090]
MEIVLPLHRNPAVREAVLPEIDGGAADRAVTAIDSMLGMGQRRPDFVA